MAPLASADNRMLVSLENLTLQVADKAGLTLYTKTILVTRRC